MLIPFTTRPVDTSRMSQSSIEEVVRGVPECAKVHPPTQVYVSAIPER
jgi:hypothetical protein